MAPATQTPPRERTSRGSGSGLGETWKVVVLNDDHNTFDGVAAALASVIPGVSFEAGFRLATTIHNTGRALVWAGHRERAEHYWTELRQRGLTMAPLET